MKRSLAHIYIRKCASSVGQLAYKLMQKGEIKKTSIQPVPGIAVFYIEPVLVKSRMMAGLISIYEGGTSL